MASVLDELAVKLSSSVCAERNSHRPGQNKDRVGTGGAGTISKGVW